MGTLSSFKTEYENNPEDEHDGFTCNECHDEFRRPLLATVSSRGNVQTYYACPRCLSKVSDVKRREAEEDKREASFSVEALKKVDTVKREADVKCQHFVGYLKKREKGVAIPDECLTCDKMIECMVR